MTKYTRKSLRRKEKNTVYVTTVYSNITHNLKNLFVMESPGQLCLKATHPHPHPGQTDAVIKGSIICASCCLSGRVPWAPGKQRLQTMVTKERDEEKGKRKMGEVDTQK